MATMDYEGYREAREAEWITKEITEEGSLANVELKKGFSQVRDTGWRKVINEGDITNHPNMAAYLRRVGNMVHFNILEHTSGALLTQTTALYVMPAGFRAVVGPTASIIHNSVVDSSANPVANSSMYMASGGTFTVSLKSIINVRHYSSFNYPTQDAWPTTLPGTAV